MKPLYTRTSLLIILAAILFLPQSIHAQSDSVVGLNTYKWGVGARLWNPSAISLKRYYHSKSIEFIFGRENPWKRNNHYYDAYLPTLSANKQLKAYELFRPWSFEVRYMVEKNISAIKGLTYNYGLGPKLSVGKFYYVTFEETGAYKVYERHKKIYATAGVDFFIGIEYLLPHLPFSLFFDTSLYIEAIHNPLYMQLNTGGGVRYRF